MTSQKKMVNANSQHRLLIRVDAGPKIGTGHVMRCLALGQAWRRMGGQVTILTSALPARLALRIKKENFELQTLATGCSKKSETQRINTYIAQHRPDWIVLDGYRFDDAYQQAILLQNTRLLVIDDFGHATHSGADAIFNQNAYADTNDYDRQNRTQEIITGLQYVLIRDEFQLDQEKPEGRQIALGQAKRILLTFGGSDPHNTTRDAIKTLDKCAIQGTTVDVIVGPCNPHFESLKSVAKQSRLSIRFHANVDRMATLFRRVDLAITAAGSTCYELCHAGVPMIAVPIADNQTPVAKSLVQQGAAMTLQPDELKSETAENMIHQLVHNPKSRQSLSSTGRNLVDGQGAARLARRLCAHLYRFRKPEEKDNSMLLDWHNDSEIRATRLGTSKASTTQPTHTSHNPEDEKQTDSWIIENRNGRPVGQIRLDSVHPNKTAIGISLVPSLRGKGIGPTLIESACRLAANYCEHVEFVAYIKPIDFASQTAFRKAGFQAISTTTINGEVALEYGYTPEHSMGIPNQVHHHLKAS